ncbi:MAG TPA: hypothetical protein VLZ07_07370, partial [Syntrophales bacterium]|nr:hypothetical protein [Syntrophales bacterium]
QVLLETVARVSPKEGKRRETGQGGIKGWPVWRIRFVPLKRTPSQREGGKVRITTVVGIAGLPRDFKRQTRLFYFVGGV